MSKKIMIVDDEPDTVELTKAVLEGEGYDIRTAGDGSEALSKLKKEGVDLILLDIMMPGMKPKEIIEEIEKLETCKNTKISYFSVVEFSADQKKELFKSDWVVDYVQKPFTNDQLVAKVKKILK